MFVDTHVHLWDRRERDLGYGWLDGDGFPFGDLVAVRAPRFSVPELRAEGRLAGLTKVVHMNAAFGAADPVAETAWLQGLADETGWPNAAVVTCDLAADDVEEQLGRHAAHAVFRGVREMGPAEVFADPAFRRGYAALGQVAGLFFHTVGWRHCGLTLDLVRAIPEVTFVLDQAGMPPDRDPETFAAWSRMLRTLAAEPNTLCKVSSLGMAEPGWTPRSRRPWVLACVEAFGADRVFLGTNWPIERLYSGYGDVVSAYREALRDLTAPEQHAVLAGNAERALRI
ncbi:amidohydrolase family protein [Xylanimonas ulmi]|uniref:Putative TIM-barrel fold metal-dependent hydrolase n=1 Tax=Xylanimonas ulmi TaxID=228973 RepID=A0A4Q7M456_9MICO|nr:amidohydrolase family protein [Xylanibacterium ulmi]RZS62141.1 putative TIM-barrel fold metal-dependent hydrolase [Xylanibacterium ulmi]